MRQCCTCCSMAACQRMPRSLSVTELPKGPSAMPGRQVSCNRRVWMGRSRLCHPLMKGWN